MDLSLSFDLFFDCLSFCGLFLKHPFQRFFPFYILYFYLSRFLRTYNNVLVFRFTFTIFPSLHPNFGVSCENMGLEPPPPLICKKTMTTGQQPIKTNIYFSHFSDNLFHIFPYPNPNFGASWEEMGMNQRCFPFFTYFFLFFPPTYLYCGDLGGKWGWTPSFHIRYSHPQIQMSTRFGKKMVLKPNRPNIHL